MDQNIACAIRKNNSTRSFHACLAVAMFRGMKTTTELRRDNLRALLSRFESQRDMADHLGVAPAYLNQLLNGYRGIGEKTARKIEKELGLSHLWLDQERVDDDCPLLSHAENNFWPIPILDPLIRTEPSQSIAHEQLREIIQAYEKMVITDDDVAVLKNVADQLVEARNPRRTARHRRASDHQSRV